MHFFFENYAVITAVETCSLLYTYSYIYTRPSSYILMCFRRFLLSISWCRWWLSVNGWVPWGCLWISYLTYFSSSYPIDLLPSFSVRSCNKIKDGREEVRIHFKLNIILEFNNYSVENSFPAPVEIITSPRQGFEIY